MNNVEFNLIRLAFTINVVVDQFGAVLFIAILYVIVKYKKLHDMPGLKLIGLFMFCCLCSKLIIWLPYLIRVVPLRQVPLWLCFSVQVVPLGFLSGIMPIAMAIGFDRLLSIFCPIWYFIGRKTLYFLALCALVALYPLYLSSFMVRNVVENAFVHTNCTTSELHGNRWAAYDLDWMFDVITITFYVLMALKLLWNGRKEREAYFTRHPIFKTFVLIVLIQVAGQWASTYAYRYIPSFFRDLGENQIPLVYYGINCFSSLVTTAEFFGIYYTSSEHRIALRREFPRLCRYFPWKKLDTTVCPLNANSNVNAITAVNKVVVVVAKKASIHGRFIASANGRRLSIK